MRLLKESPTSVHDALLLAADEYASPRDPVIAFWAALKAYANAAASENDPLKALELASANQGRVNQLVKRGPR
jgi:hypothetical protein